MQNTNIQEKLQIMQDTVQEKFKRLHEYLNENSEFSKLVQYLLTTERNPYGIINGGYSQECISSFLNLIHELHHSIDDDGDITFYSINNEPRISLKYDFTEEYGLNDFEKQLEKNHIKMSEKYPKLKDVKLYEFKKLPYDIDNWIKLSEEYHYNDIKECFMSDYNDTDKFIIEHYRKYKVFDENWIKEAKENK